MNKWGAAEGRMFLGSLDDSVSRYPWKSLHIDLDALNRSLIYYALLGPRLCVRSGNILYNPVYYETLKSPEKSPLLSFAEAGFIQLQTRKEGFNASVEDRLEIGTNSTKKFREREGWLNLPHNNTYKLLSELDHLLQEGKGRLHYNPDFVPIFKKLCDDLIVTDDTPFAEIYYEWYHRFDRLHRSRSNFEDLTNNILKERPYIDRFQAMQTINSINHYAYGIALNDLTGAASIETKEIRSFQALTKTLVGQEERYVPYDIFKEISGRNVLNTLCDNLRVPARLFRKEPGIWKQLAKLLDPDGGENSRQFQSKKQRLTSLIFQVLDEHNRVDLERDLIQTAKDYSDFLNDALHTKARKQLGLRMNFLFRKSASIAKGLTVGWLVDPLKDELEAAGQVGVDILTSIADDTASGAIVRGIDHVLISPEEAAKISPKELGGVFNGLSMRELDIDAATLLAK